MAKVQVQQGWLEGEILENSLDKSKPLYSFKGIPYGKPPVGPLRFKAPLPAEPWDGVRQAKEHGPVCPQKDIFTQEIILGNEDCLYLNVYSPNLKPTTPLAVMVFIHGGGFKSGSGNEDNYGPDFLVANDVVLITINYRLEVFGFLCLDTKEIPGNAGMKDQVLALKWVKQNIHHFGGNTNNITIFGESAGGSSAALHILSPMSKGLFKRSIAMSGVPFCDWSLPFEARKRAFVLGKELGLDTNDPTELLEFLQSVSVEKLIDVHPCVLASETVIGRNIIKMFPFTPVVEKVFGTDHFLTETPYEILNKGKVNDVDALIGYTNMELLVGVSVFEETLIDYYNKFEELVVPIKILREADTKTVLKVADRIKKHYFGNKPISKDTMKELVHLTNESTFMYDIERFIKLLAKIENGKKKYLYKFSMVSKRNVYGQLGEKYGLKGASHLDDLMYLFDAKKVTEELGSEERRLVGEACRIFTDFVKSGNVEWPEFQKGEYYAELTGDQIRVGQYIDKDAVAFWHSIFEEAGVKLH